jgi:ABC-type bacteriocin/lantibiotic exporter with double-glycine peptidase domain
MDVLAIVPQRQRMDCGVAALAMLVGQPYEDVFAAATHVQPKVGKVGLYQKELIAIAELLGVTLERKRRPDLDTDVGILNVRNTKLGHYVVLHAGVIADPAGGLVFFDVDDFLALGHFTARTLLARKD